MGSTQPPPTQPNPSARKLTSPKQPPSQKPKGNIIEPLSQSMRTSVDENIYTCSSPQKIVKSDFMAQNQEHESSKQRRSLTVKFEPLEDKKEDSIKLIQMERSDKTTNLSGQIKKFNEEVQKITNKLNPERSTSQILNELSSKIQIEKKISSEEILRKEESLGKITGEYQELRQELERQRINKDNYQSQLKEKNDLIDKRQKEIDKLKAENQKLKDQNLIFYEIQQETRIQRENMLDKLKYLISHCGQQQAQLSLKTGKVKTLKRENNRLRESCQVDKSVLSFVDSQKIRLEKLLREQIRNKEQISKELKFYKEKDENISLILSNLIKSIKNKQWLNIQKQLSEVDPIIQLQLLSEVLNGLNQTIIDLTSRLSQKMTAVPSHRSNK